MIATHIIEQGCQTSGPGAISAACSPTFFLCFPINTVYCLGNKRVVLEFYIIFIFNKNKTKQRATNFSKLYPK